MGKNSVRTCVFCGKAGVTREHVIPQWVLERLVPAGHGAPYRHSSGDGNIITHRWLAPSLNFTVKRVCKACNAGWMSHDIEVPNIPRLTPMMRNEATVLGAAAQAGVAAWCYKTMAMALFRSGGPRYSAPEHIRHLYTTHQAPDEARVLLGRYDAPSEFLIDGFSQRFELSPTSDPRDSRPDQIITGELFKLRLGALLVVCLVGSDGMMLGTPVGVEDTLISVTPRVADTVAWPPAHSVVSEDEFKGLTRLLVRGGRSEESP